MSDITRIDHLPDPERRTPAEAPAEERASFLALLAQDANVIVTSVAATVAGGVILDKIMKGGGGDPPAGGQSKDAPPPEAD
jgi:hypothetical protein